MISACDATACTPGSQEAAGEAREDWVAAKDRNLRLPWAALQHALETALELQGDMKTYRRMYEEGRWWWWMGPGGRLTEVGPGRATKQRCPAVLPPLRRQPH